MTSANDRAPVPEDDLLKEASSGSREALDALFSRHRERLCRMVALRLDRHLQGRVDASDVIQEAFLEAFHRFPEYLENRPAPFFLWLRFLTRQKLATFHRRHLGTQGRDPRREVALGDDALAPATSDSLAAQLLGTWTTPTQAAVRAELKSQVDEALRCMDPVDREVLALRHFEQLSNVEAALELGITEAAASKRYIRAVRRMRDVLSMMRAGSGSDAR